MDIKICVQSVRPLVVVHPGRVVPSLPSVQSVGLHVVLTKKNEHTFLFCCLLYVLPLLLEKKNLMTTCNNGACPCTIPRTYLTDRSDAFRTRRQEILLARGDIPAVVQPELDAQFQQTFYPGTESRPTCLTCRHYIEVHVDPQPRVSPAVVPPAVPPLPLSAKALQGLEALGRQVQRTSPVVPSDATTPRSVMSVESGGGDLIQVPVLSSHTCQACKQLQSGGSWNRCPHGHHVCPSYLRLCDGSAPCGGGGGYVTDLLL